VMTGRPSASARRVPVPAVAPRTPAASLRLKPAERGTDYDRFRHSVRVTLDSPRGASVS
jgi:hypothetical protein